jgi:hypothetical protein
LQPKHEEDSGVGEALGQEAGLCPEAVWVSEQEEEGVRPRADWRAAAGQFSWQKIHRWENVRQRHVGLG